MRIHPETVAGRWCEQYRKPTGEWGTIHTGDTEKIYEQIVAAGNDAGAIDAAIGNDSWTRHFCGCCGKTFDTGIRFMEPDYENTPDFCSACIQEAAEMLRNA